MIKNKLPSKDWKRFKMNIYVKNRAVNSDFKSGIFWNNYQDMFFDHWVLLQDKTYGPALKTQDSSSFCKEENDPNNF